jgi:6,7-dimethyl-8-ribityllumazine synthase
LKIGVVTSMFNEEVTQPLEAGTLDFLSECDVEVYSVRVPGAVEIPLAAQALFDYKKIDGVIVLRSRYPRRDDSLRRSLSFS